MKCLGAVCQVTLSVVRFGRLPDGKALSVRPSCSALSSGARPSAGMVFPKMTLSEVPTMSSVSARPPKGFRPAGACVAPPVSMPR